MRLWVAAGVLIGTAPAVAQTPWTEAAVLTRTRAHAPAVLRAERVARVAEAAVEGAGLHPNPTLDWERQESFAPNAQSQDVIRARIPFDVSGRRAAASHLAELEAAGARTRAAETRQDVAAEALGLFYRALAAERRIALLEQGQATLDEVSRILAVRESQNVASGYERARLTLEAELGRSRLARASAERQGLLGQLAALLGAPLRPVRGDFEVGPPAALAELERQALRAHPSLEGLRSERASAQQAQDAAETAWIPPFAVFGGYNVQVGPQLGHGYAVGLEVELPFFARGQGEQAQARAALDALGAEADARTAELGIGLRTAHARLVALLAERTRFADATRGPTELVWTAAQSGYEGGARTLVELLDARRASLDVGERLVALDLAVRLADVALRQRAGAL